MKRLALLFCGLFGILGLLSPTHTFAGQDYRHRVSTQLEHFEDLDDVRAEISFGREVAAHILGQYGLYEDKNLTRYVSLVGQSLVLQSGRSEIDYHFAVLDTSEPNAYAAPGGYIFITRGALATMADESELAAVLSHELAHVNAKHIVHELKIRGREEQGGALLSSLIGGITDPMRVAFAQMVDLATEILLKRGYKLEDESEADRLAITYTSISGYNPFGLIHFLDRLSLHSEAKDSSQLGTHKPNRERNDDLTNYLQANHLIEDTSKNLKERFIQNVQL